jgi:hypothetical protein
MGLAPLGSVFGDMDTSPLYTLKTVFVELGVVLHWTVFPVIEKAWKDWSSFVRAKPFWRREQNAK